MQAIGKRRWTIAGGRIPLESNGPEPEFTSRDEIAVLNCCDSPARLRIHIHYADRPAVGPYEVEVAAGRVRRIRFNDLIFPEALPLDEDFGAVIDADIPVVVQFTRLDSGTASRSAVATAAYAERNLQGSGR
ncbi:sensory rhodopsin transducer [Sinorhizobium meliloti]|uniref:sensory rhodopsin transducer n=1 Tax=Rhizobium meliloti TaxID=382 RepID=UPI0002E4528F|nr:sensory rhodopsin transducer [Sinorhizobium meliloti]MDE3815063.1 sensory rhodopsin transducer [Sinorhizobium meliloti]MDE4598174.1 sensory rhodopsin transducer [Sinorhizobium meliloti]MDW9429164.1 sensory rhodopsin transducer [Sinorhizobium meliloti]MQV79824.1 sensory rhodopsin transducer [Sinorhizobium meliloti]RVG95203.1 sensory rhodopsin transducer [Sinorhizobium meliloti]